jgi:hypothetical protein
MSDFAIKWLKGCGIVFVAFGALFSVIDLPLIGIPARLFNEAAFLQPLQGLFPTNNKPLVAMSGIVGALTLFVGFLLYFVTDVLAKMDPAALRKCVLLSATSWYVLDQWASYRGEAYGNMVSNTVILLALVVPFLAQGRRAAAA